MFRWRALGPTGPLPLAASLVCTSIRLESIHRPCVQARPPRSSPAVCATRSTHADHLDPLPNGSGHAGSRRARGVNQDKARDGSLTSAAAYFASIAEQLHSEPSEEVTLERICAQTLDVIPNASHCGITLRRRRGRLETVVASDPIVAQCDALQYELGEGPCLDAATDQAAFVVRDIASDSRWPLWGPKAAALGMHSMLAVHLTAPQSDDEDAPLGAINIYDGRIGTFNRDDLDRALIYATHAASALAAAQAISGLETAVHSRHLIGVAQGILMQRYGMSLDRSFEALRRYSSESNIKLRLIAEMVVQNRGLPTGPPPSSQPILQEAPETTHPPLRVHQDRVGTE